MIHVQTIPFESRGPLKNLHASIRNAVQSVQTTLTKDYPDSPSFRAHVTITYTCGNHTIPNPPPDTTPVHRFPSIIFPKQPAPSKIHANRAENIFQTTMRQAGFFVSAKGWPDFICLRGNQVAVVEVKPHRGRKLRSHQTAIMLILAAFGIPVYRWSPDVGFLRFTPEGKPTGAPVQSLQVPSSHNPTPDNPTPAEGAE